MEYLGRRPVARRAPLPDGRLAFEPACTLTAPLNPASVFPRGFNVMFGAADNSSGSPIRRPACSSRRTSGRSAKSAGLPGGWIAFSNAAAGYAFIERFEVVPGAEYRTAGRRSDLTVGAGQVGNLSYEGSDMYHMEAEVLGPLRTLAPGGTSTFAIEWGACRCPGAVVAASEGVPERAPGARAGRGRVRAGHRVGRRVCKGELWLVWGTTGAAHWTRSLGPVDPLAVVALDRSSGYRRARHLALQLTWLASA